MRHLRSSFYIAIISLFVLTGYGSDLFGDCCAHHDHAQVEHGEEQGGSAPHDQTPSSGEACQCICHMIITPLMPEPVWVADAAFVQADFMAARDEFPPDTEPQGIDYPPQLA